MWRLLGAHGMIVVRCAMASVVQLVRAALPQLQLLMRLARG
jgi:hypothetical protein